MDQRRNRRHTVGRFSQHRGRSGCSRSALVYAGRLSEAIHQFEQAVAGHESSRESDVFAAIRNRHNLAIAYGSADRITDAIESFERSLVDHERVLGLDHSDTFSARSHLIAAYRSAGRLADEINLAERQLAESERVHGLVDPKTRYARQYLANSYELVGRHDEAFHLRQQNGDSAEDWWANSPVAERLRAVDAYGMSGQPRETDPRPRRRWRQWWKS
ncbi:tetratricopeptide repeat protein [Nocardia pseudobrasiliensis]|uniref:tetratricopeptide repeat protein n=1 Tax=Nocardia pseudobrasiliensis TaxID=45979 RepID=UPI0009EED6BB